MFMCVSVLFRAFFLVLLFFSINVVIFFSTQRLSFYFRDCSFLYVSVFCFSGTYVFNSFQWLFFWGFWHRRATRLLLPSPKLQPGFSIAKLVAPLLIACPRPLPTGKGGMTGEGGTGEGRGAPDSFGEARNPNHLGFHWWLEKVHSIQVMTGEHPLTPRVGADDSLSVFPRYRHPHICRTTFLGGGCSRISLSTDLRFFLGIDLGFSFNRHRHWNHTHFLAPKFEFPKPWSMAQLVVKGSVIN